LSTLILSEEKEKIGMSYEEYREMSALELENYNLKDFEQKEKNRFAILRINLQRIKRLEKQFQPSNTVIEAVEKIKRPQFWLLITESWCGDSAQSVPVINIIAGLNNNIELRLILRDAHKEISDRYYEPGQPRSIPLLIAYDEKNNELFRWGARPKHATELVKNLKNNGLSKDEYNKELHLWYGKNKGKDIENEIAELINKSNND
jgi:phage pi2 protein 07